MSASLPTDFVRTLHKTRSCSCARLHKMSWNFVTYIKNSRRISNAVPGIVHRTLATHLIHKAGYKNCDAHTGAVTLIQRLGGALNLNIHFHMLFLDGVYVDRGGNIDVERCRVCGGKATPGRPRSLPRSRTRPSSTKSSHIWRTRRPVHKQRPCRRFVHRQRQACSPDSKICPPHSL